MNRIWKYFFIYIYVLLFHFKLCETNVANKGFINAKMFSEIGENLGIDDVGEVQAIVKLLLDNCTLTSMSDLNCLGQCVGWCQLNLHCKAVTYTRDAGCMHCLPIEADGTGSGGSVDLSLTMLSKLHLNVSFAYFYRPRKKIIDLFQNRSL